MASSEFADFSGPFCNIHGDEISPNRQVSSSKGLDSCRDP